MPTLDALAMRGIRFTNFHGHISCGPSRAYPDIRHDQSRGRVGHSQVEIPAFRRARNYERYLVDRVATLPEVLGASGYRTCIAGIWGSIGRINTLTDTHRPLWARRRAAHVAVAQAVPEPVIVNAGEAGAIRTGNVT